MTPKQQLPRVAAVLSSLTFLQTIPPAAAYDAGDAVALLLGTVVAMVGFCACLGWYARKRNRLL
ncbi:small integral membrane protein 30-like [Phyllopteryx taeniolatus]|uniref:small integral membrane protein 30-like n=1 Tax=Phycodurus eques TaxID=693459 RepID=UPI002ACE2B34|nr:small integral membrane protein 30-like [Phycodurus eques]XP_061618444.1 small integral membrane protein 30-like [Phyllopteryx taeniolatus]